MNSLTIRSGSIEGERRHCRAEKRINSNLIYVQSLNIKCAESWIPVAEVKTTLHSRILFIGGTVQILQNWSNHSVLQHTKYFKCQGCSAIICYPELPYHLQSIQAALSCASHQPPSCYNRTDINHPPPHLRWNRRGGEEVPKEEQKRWDRKKNERKG